MGPPEYWKRFVEIVVEEFERWPTPASRIVARVQEFGDPGFIKMLYDALPEWRREEFEEERANRDAYGAPQDAGFGT